MTAPATIAILQRARASVIDGPFAFHDWTCCTCGHLYAAATGSVADRRGDVRVPTPGTPYAEAVLAIARVLEPDARRFRDGERPWYDRRSPATLAVRAISDATMRPSLRRRDHARAADALAVIDRAIARIESADVHVRPLSA